MSVYTLASLNPQAQGQRPGGVATGHVPQQPNLGLGPNRYVPPTFNWGRGGLDGRQPQYTQMDWNQMQGFYMPQQQNNTFTNPYMQQLQGMLGMFSNQYGGPNRQPTLPQFSSYNPGFGGPTSFYDQSLQDWGRSAMDMQRNMGQGGGGGYVSDQSQWFNADGSQYDPTAMRMAMGITGDDYNPIYDRQGNRINVPGGGRQGPGADYFRNLFEGGGGGMQNPEGFGDQFAVMPSSGPGPGADYFRSLFGGSGGRGGYPQMPQFNPYMLARNNMMGMDFNEMFDPRYAMLFGMGGLGAMRPQGFAATQPQQPPSTANGQKPLAIGGGGDSSGMQRNPVGFLEPTAPYGSQDYWRSRYDQYYRDLESGGWSGNRIPYEQWQREVSQPVYALGGGG